MKLSPIALPAAAVVVVLFWMGPKQAEVLRLERETEAITTKLAEAQMVEARAAARGTRGGGPTDKRAAADLLTLARFSEPDERMYEAAAKRLKQLSAEELLETYGEVDAMDLPRLAKRMLQNLLFKRLAALAPDQAMDRYLHRNLPAGDAVPLEWVAFQVFLQWTALDPEAAAAWCDDEVAASSSVSKHFRGKMESAVLSRLTPAEARHRLESLPEDEQRAQLKRLRRQGMIDPARDREYAALMREYLLPEEVKEVFAAYVDPYGKLSDVGDFLRHADATPEEEEAVALSFARTHLQRFNSDGERGKEFRNTRRWLMEVAPASADSALGGALSISARHSEDSFPKLIELASELHTEGAGDEIIVTFLTSDDSKAAVQAHLTDAQTLAERIREPGQKQTVRDHLQNLAQPQP